MGWTWVAGPAISSAFVPSPCSPITWIRPPPASMPGLRTTRSPGSKPLTPSPSASTTPAPSAPRMRGFGTDGIPLRIQTSRWFSAEARRRTSTSPAPGSGSGPSSSTSTSGPPSSWIRTARTAAHYPRDRSGTRGPRPGARARRDRRRAGRALHRHRAPHPRAARPLPLRRHALHDGASRGVVPSRDAAARRPHRRVGGALLLAPRAGAPRRARPAAALHVVRRVRAAAGEARRARAEAGWGVPGPRRRKPARRPRGGCTQRRRLLRQEHAPDHAPARLLGRARDAHPGRRARADPAAGPRLRRGPALHRSAPYGRSRRAGNARLDALSLLLDAGARAAAGPVPRRAGGPGLRLRHLPGRVPVESRRRDAARGQSAAGGCDAARLAPGLAPQRPGRAAEELRAALRPAKRRPPRPAERAGRGRQRGWRRRTGRRDRPPRRPGLDDARNRGVGAGAAGGRGGFAAPAG